MNVTFKKLQHRTIKSFYNRLKEIDALATSLLCMREQDDFPPEIEFMNVSLTPVNMWNLLMHSVLATVENGCNCMTDLMPTDLKKLGKQFIKIETKLKLVPSKTKPEDRRNGKGQPKTGGKICSSKKRVIAEASCELKDATPWKAIQKKAKGNANYVKSMEVHHILIILLSAINELQAENIIKSGKAKKPPILMSIGMLVSINSWLNKPSSRRQ